MKIIKVLIVDDHTLIRDGIRALLSLASDIEVVGEAANGKEALEKAKELSPDVVLMDLSMPIMGGLEATRRIRKESGDTCSVNVVDVSSRVGGGAMPEQNLASQAVVVRPTVLSVSQLETRLRQLEVPVVGRIEEDSLVLDMRTVADDEVLLLASCLQTVLSGKAE